jgi:hypothetical protein
MKNPISITYDKDFRIIKIVKYQNNTMYNDCYIQYEFKDCYTTMEFTRVRSGVIHEYIKYQFGKATDVYHMFQNIGIKYADDWCKEVLSSLSEFSSAEEVLEKLEFIY